MWKLRQAARNQLAHLADRVCLGCFYRAGPGVVTQGEQVALSSC